MEILLSDPTGRPEGQAGLGEALALRLICDRRDVPFLSLMAVQSITIIPTALVLFVPGPFRWWLAAVHLALVVYFFAPFVLMLHNTSHRRLFRRPWGVLNHYIPWVLGPFFGESPETYFAHHIGMHHPENNLEDDLSTTMPYVRDSVVGFARYFLKFFLFALPTLATYHLRRGRRALMVRTVVGEFVFFALVGGLLFVNWRATTVVFVAPLFIARFAMMAGNWGQHAFVDRDAPDNCYRNSITCINSSYNRRCFNDGYHIGHHIKSTRHWTEMPEDFLRNVKTYDAEGAIVFRGLDFFGVWLCLMLKRYDWLAGRFVQLGEAHRSREEIIALLRSRTGWTRSAAT
ncbi:MAG TPA: fatty acid desaturase [Polyangiaceae bacterium]|nr:fatty acid desaturase [Polyangiaceae bacterium]